MACTMPGAGEILAYLAWKDFPIGHCPLCKSKEIDRNYPGSCKWCRGEGTVSGGCDDTTFLARMVLALEAGHATPADFGRLRELAR